MGRARRSTFSIVLVLLALAGLTIAVPQRAIQVADAASVGWPTSTLLLSETMTGGASASDEFIELVNAGPATTDLIGLEVVYVTSSGSSVTQKASWTGSRPLAPGQHLLIANAAGSYAALADATYAGGLSATGGAAALRVIGGATIDALGWGDAANAFVEASAAPAPPARSSLERLPGGSAGNGIDTNDDAVDWFVQPSPSPQDLASPPTPTLPTPPASPTPSATRSPRPGEPSPSPAPTATAYPSWCIPTGSPTTMPSPTLTTPPSVVPTPSTGPTAAPVAIVDARAMPLGATTRLRGVVTAEAGRPGSPALLAIADETAGIVVRLPAGAAGPRRGTLIEVVGALAAPYGQLEVRPAAGAIAELGLGTEPEPVPVLSTQLGEAVEGAIVALDVVMDNAAHRETNGTLTLDALDPTTGGRFSIRADASSGIATSDLPRHARAHLVGLAGQRATRTGRLDGYRVWLRDRADIVISDPPPSAPPTPGASPSASPPSATTSIAQALLSPGSSVRVVGTVTAAGRLLDSTGRLVVIQDTTAAVAVRIPTGVATPRVGVRLRVDGSVGRAYGAPRLAATAVASLGTGAPVLPLALRTAPGAAHEWRLVRLEGVVTDVHRLGDRWRAEVAIGSTRVLVSGLPGAGIPASALVAGRRAIVIGVVRRPYPTTADRRFAVVPRSAADVRLGPPAGAGGPGDPSAGPGSNPGPASGALGGSGSDPAGPPDVDVATLAEHRGQVVRVGGIVTAVAPGSILVDDGTAVGRIVLGGDAATYLALLSAGDALVVVGRVGGSLAAPVVEVTSASDIVRVGDPGADPGDPGTSDPAETQGGPGTRAESGTAPSGEPGTAAAASVLVAVGGCAALAVLAAAMFAVRRRRERRSMDDRIALRLTSLGGGGADPLTPA